MDKDKFVFVKVKTSCKSYRISFNKDINMYECSVVSRPIEGRANKELIKLFKDALKMKVEIVSGENSMIKKLRVVE